MDKTIQTVRTYLESQITNVEEVTGEGNPKFKLHDTTKSYFDNVISMDLMLIAQPCPVIIDYHDPNCMLIEFDVAAVKKRQLKDFN